MNGRSIIVQLLTMVLTPMVLTLVGVLTNQSSHATINLHSPSGQLRMQLYRDQNGRLLYSVSSKQTGLLIKPSALGIHLNNTAFGANVSTVRLLRSELINEKYPVRGKHASAHNYCRVFHIEVREAGRTWQIEARLFEDGVAWRYLFNGSGNNHISQEYTAWQLPETGRIWYFERNSDWKLKSYAGLWQSTVADSLPIISRQGPVQGKPLVIQLQNKKYLVITEAALYNYSGLRLKAIGNRTLQANFTEGENGFTIQGPITTPWRVVIHAKNLDALVNTDLINNLNPAPDKKLFANTNYIRPGRSVWSWITRNDRYLQPDEEQKFIDYAARLHFEYTMIDDGWEKKWADKWKQLRELSDYATSKKVKVWVWKHSNELRDPLVRDLFLDSVQQYGAAGIKVDFMNSEAKPLIDFEIGLLEACAQRKLLVNFHGCHAPTGESRTFPNEMTREGIRGLELNIMNEPIPAWHNAALPFTRFICGQGDYTPAFFSNRANTTWTHQLALLYLFDSPLQCLAEHPGYILEHDKEQIIEPLLQTLPVVWDETKVLAGSDIGKLAAFARRKGSTWYVAVINGGTANKQWTFQPSFLDKKNRYRAQIITDNGQPNDSPLNSTKLGVDHQYSKSLSLPGNGGIVIKIEK